MGVQGKVKFSIYLEPADTMLVRDFLESSRLLPGWSEFLCMILADFANRIRQADEEGWIDELIDEYSLE